MVENAKCAKRRRKNEEIIRNFARSYLGIGWRDLLQIWYVARFSISASINIYYKEKGIMPVSPARYN